MTVSQLLSGLEERRNEFDPTLRNPGRGIKEQWVKASAVRPIPGACQLGARLKPAGRPQAAQPAHLRRAPIARPLGPRQTERRRHERKRQPELDRILAGL